MRSDKQGFCPICSSDLTGHYNNKPFFCDTEFFFSWCCPNCGTIGEEHYSMSFDSHYNMYNDDVDDPDGTGSAIMDLSDEEIETLISSKKYNL